MDINLKWGKYKENGVWFTTWKQYRVMFFGHDSLYIAINKFRIRLMKFWI